MDQDPQIGRGQLYKVEGEEAGIQIPCSFSHLIVFMFLMLNHAQDEMDYISKSLLLPGTGYFEEKSVVTSIIKGKIIIKTYILDCFNNTFLMAKTITLILNNYC